MYHVHNDCCYTFGFLNEENQNDVALFMAVKFSYILTYK